MKRREDPRAQAQIAVFRARQMHRKGLERAKRIGAAIADAVIEKATSDRTLDDMVDMKIYLGLPEDLVQTLYLHHCVPHAAIRDGLTRAIAA
jgi:hypothetical protein